MRFSCEFSVGLPNQVPALRMLLDLVTYVLMMIIFGSSVLLHDSPTLSWSEFVFSVYIFVSARQRPLQL